MHSTLSKNLTILILSTNICLSLCGCSTTSETFDCQAGQGVGCKSITEVNQLVDQQAQNQQNRGKETEQDTQSIGVPQNTESFPSPIIFQNPPKIDHTKGFVAPISLSDTFTVQRMPEEYLRVWIAPFQDNQGNLHEGSVIHTIVKPGCWKMMGAQNRQPNEHTN
jgi:conjugal transfer pilus assembly protein TraV